MRLIGAVLMVLAGERCMAISRSPCLWAYETDDPSDEKAVPRIENAESRALYFGQGTVDYGPLVTAAAKANIRTAGATGVDQGAHAASSTAAFQLQGIEAGFFCWARTSLTMSPRQDHLQRHEDFSGQFCPPYVQRPLRKRRLGLAMDSREWATAPRIFTRDGDAARDFAGPRERRHDRHQRGQSRAAGPTQPWGLEKIGSLSDLNQHRSDAFNSHTHLTT